MANKNEPTCKDMTSNDLSSILQTFRDCKENTRIAEADLCEVEGELQDVLHKLELDSGLTYKDMAALGKRISELRKRRRIAKDRIELQAPIVAYIAKNQQLINGLSIVLGEMRKVENRHKNRTYTPRIKTQQAGGQP